MRKQVGCAAGSIVPRWSGIAAVGTIRLAHESSLIPRDVVEVVTRAESVTPHQVSDAGDATDG